MKANDLRWLKEKDHHTIITLTYLNKEVEKLSRKYYLKDTKRNVTEC